MPEPEETVAEFYAPVMAGRPQVVQSLVVRLLRRDFKQTGDLEDEIIAAARSELGEGDSR